MNVFSFNLKKVVSVLLVSSFFIGYYNFNGWADNKVLTIDTAVKYAQDTSSDYKNKKDSRGRKKMQLTQAIEAVKDARKKESTVRYSLLFNIKFPEKHGLPTETELLLKIPQIEMEIRNITKELEQIKLKTQQQTEDCFISVYEYDQKANMAQTSLNNLNEKLEKMETQLGFGAAKESDITSLRNQIKTQETQLATYLSNLENSKEKLSELVGFDVTNGYIFKNPLKKFDVDRVYLDQLINYSLNNDAEVFKVRNAENMARRKVNEIYGIYGSQWAGKVKMIEREVRSNSATDLDDLLSKYEVLLNQIDDPWKGNYVIKLLFFKIKIPKEWFKGEFSGTRYFENEKYSIIVAIKEKEDAIRETQSIEKELKSEVKNGLETLKMLWKNYDMSVDEAQKAQKQYDRVFMANKIGQASFDEVESERLNLDLAKTTVLDNLISYNRQLSAYNKTTCGAVSSLMEDVDVFLNSAKAGDSVMEYEEVVENEEDGILYYINNEIDQRKSLFGIQVLDGYPNDVTHYEVLTPERNVIGNRTTVDNEISVLPVEYSGSTEFFVRLYNDDKFVVEGSFDSMLDRGKLKLLGSDTSEEEEELQDNNQEEINSVIGSYDVSTIMGGTIKNISFNIPASQGVSFYKLLNENGYEVGKADKFYTVEEVFSYLGFALNDLSNITVDLYDANYGLKYECSFDDITNEITVKNN